MTLRGYHDVALATEAGKVAAELEARVPQTPTDCAHHLLNVFRSFDRRDGECLRQNSFLQPFGELGWRADDFNTGLALCLDRGWTTIGPSGGICVTQAGLDEIDA